MKNIFIKHKASRSHPSSTLTTSPLSSDVLERPFPRHMSRGVLCTLKGKILNIFNNVFTNLLFIRTLRCKLAQLGLT